MASSGTDYDLVVIGGGINGAGIARDAALRGLRVLLLEKNDFGSGTSSWSSRLIHGGLRYLEHAEIPLVFESLHERRRLQALAPHLVRRLRLTIPVYSQSRRGMLLIRLGMMAYDLLSVGKKNPRHRMLSREELLASEPGVNEDGLLGAAQYYDAQVSYAERLVLENIIGAREAGAEVLNYSPVIGITVAKRRLQSIQYEPHDSDQEVEITAGMVVNAAGPWVDKVLATVNREIPRYMGGTKGSHIVVGDFSGAPQSAFYVEAHSDGRPFFIIPWNDQYLIGTTDIRYHGDPGDVVASVDEIRYLLEESNRVFPSANLTMEDVHYAYAGVRPLPLRRKGPESAITRKHIIKKHRRVAKGLVSIIGGKLTTYRNLSEQTVDYAVRALKLDARDCATRTRPLPGAVDLEQSRDALRALSWLSDVAIDRLLGIYGGRAIQVAELAAERPELSKTLDDDESVLAAEVIHAVRHEHAIHLTDIVHRRLMIGLAADQGVAMYRQIADIAATESNWSRAEKQRNLDELQAYSARLRAVPTN
ncbi:MAG: glycerol-3-phosphate dehydrogenase [Woeseiaceae bacterium]|nr:glycerol-3-phosphate dehydrogenase [Woeseiaceae bacterium]